MFFYCIILAIIFFIAAILFGGGWGFNLIKAWRNSPQAEKDKINLSRLGKSIFAEFFLAGLIILAAGLFENFRLHYFIWFMAGWFLLTILNLYLMQKTKWYMRK